MTTENFDKILKEEKENRLATLAFIKVLNYIFKCYQNYALTLYFIPVIKECIHAFI